MKIWGLLFSLLLAAPAQADVSFGGASAKFYYSQLSNRGTGVSAYKAKSLPRTCKLARQSTLNFDDRRGQRFPSLFGGKFT